MSSAPLVVVGDALLDRDVVGTAERLAPDAPVPVVQVQAEYERPGGAALAALMAARSYDGPVRFITSLGGGAGDAVARFLRSEGVHVIDLGGTRTVVKTRVRVEGQCLLRLDTAGAPKPSSYTLELRPQRLRSVRATLSGAAAILASDYGNGLLDRGSLREVLGVLAGRKHVVWDPHPRGGPPVAGVTVAAPNRNELARASSGCVDGLAKTVAAGRNLLDDWGCTALAVTLGADGALRIDRSGAAEVVPAQPGIEAGDTCGAGDAFAVACTCTLASGGTVADSVGAAVAAATDFVRSGGAAAVGVAARPGQGLDLSDTAPGPLRAVSGAPTARLMTEPTNAVVATSGCFDLLHAGHVAMLQQARGLGDRLVVLLNSDGSVRRLKGRDRPIQSDTDRAAVLRSLAAVDEVRIFEEDTPLNALEQLKPDIFVKGGDYVAADLPEAALLAHWGGVTVTVPYLSGRSTSQLTKLLQEASAHVDDGH